MHMNKCHPQMLEEDVVVVIVTNVNDIPPPPPGAVVVELPVGPVVGGVYVEVL